MVLTSSEQKPTCAICARLLNDPEDPVRSRDCGGDCLECMALVGEDPDCIAALNSLKSGSEVKR